MTSPFTDHDKDLLKSLNQRVINQLPKLHDFTDCIITGPAVAEMAASTALPLVQDRTFIIFAEDTYMMDKITDNMWTFYSIRPLQSEAGLKIINDSKYLKWFTMDYIDLVAGDVRVFGNIFSTTLRIILSHHSDHREYCNHFKYHPIFCYKGKTYVNLFRLKEAKRYAGIIDDKL